MKKNRGTIAALSNKEGRKVGRKRTRKPSRELSLFERKFADRLSSLIGDRSNAVADAVKVSPDAVRKWCCGESFPSLDRWPALVKALGLKDERDLLPLT